MENVKVGSMVLVIPTWYIVDEIVGDTLFCLDNDGETYQFLVRDLDWVDNS
jgi:hypothetical protein